MTHPSRDRSYRYPLPLPSPAPLLERSGFEAMRAMANGELPPPSIAATLDYTLTHVAEGEATFEGEVPDYVFNPLGSVHGGYVSTLLDSALGCAVHTTLPAGLAYTSATLEVKFLRALRPDVGRVRAEGRVVHPGSRVAVAEARLVGVRDGKLYATATSTCFVFDPRQRT
ncbi:PaaI family thioesterase [Sandaracinus amylolyticus]|uniref:PaaI family thioesterase n=1 Tax=Sandaracinus amylolyticus TaxID=927083 RepID=UPI001F315D08|nr:PaaI family thioesterase [Sandaracinus amylolyticus]UJR87143.1 Hypothetical protein I5071_92440 [Sandaracinus amylolyticus]